MTPSPESKTTPVVRPVAYLERFIIPQSICYLRGQRVAGGIVSECWVCVGVVQAGA